MLFQASWEAKATGPTSGPGEHKHLEMADPTESRLWLKKPLEKHAVHAARSSLRLTRQEWPAQCLELRNVRSLAFWNLLSLTGESSRRAVPPSVSCGQAVTRLLMCPWRIRPLVLSPGPDAVGDHLLACMPLTIGSSLLYSCRTWQPGACNWTSFLQEALAPLTTWRGGHCSLSTPPLTPPPWVQPPPGPQDFPHALCIQCVLSRPKCLTPECATCPMAML